MHAKASHFLDNADTVLIAYCPHLYFHVIPPPLSLKPLKFTYIHLCFRVYILLHVASNLQMTCHFTQLEATKYWVTLSNHSKFAILTPHSLVS